MQEILECCMAADKGQCQNISQIQTEYFKSEKL